MKLISLKINNIASISYGEIDFTKTPLKEAPIFLICGDTGSGKTTILDAICLALYDKTPRLSNRNASAETQFSDNGQSIDIKKVVQLLKNGETSGNVTLQFEGIDNNVYTANWSCKISPRGHKLENEVWTITNAFGRQEKATESLMKEITGMDFEQFCRTSMLAQGEFTKFLKAESKDKSDILEKITGTEIYSKIGKNIHNRYIRAKQEYDKAVAAIGSIVLLPSEEVEKYNYEISSLKKAVEDNMKEISKLDKLISAYEAIERSTIDKNESLSQRSECKNEFRNLLCGLAFDIQTISELKIEKNSLDSFISGKKPLSSMYENAQTITSELDNISKQELIKQSKESEKSQASIELEELHSKQSELMAHFKEMSLILKSKQDSLQKAKADREKLSPDNVELERQSIINESKIISSAKFDFAKIKTDSERLDKEIKANDELGKEIKKDEAILNEIINKTDSAKIRFETVDKLYRKQKECTEKFVSDLRERLREIGADECPVCHSKINNLPTKEDEEESLRPVRMEWEKYKKEFDNAKTEQHKAEIALGIKKETFNTNEESVNSLKKRIDFDKDTFSKKYSYFLKFDTNDILSGVDAAESELRVRREDNEKAIKQLKAQEKIIEQCDIEIKRYEKDIFEPARNDVEDINKQIIAVKGKVLNSIQGIKDAEEARKESFEKVSSLILYSEWEEKWSLDKMSFKKRISDESKDYFEAIASAKNKEIVISGYELSIKDAEEIKNFIIKSNNDFNIDNISPFKFSGNSTVCWGQLKQSVINLNETIRKVDEIIAQNRKYIEKFIKDDEVFPDIKEKLINRKGELTNDNNEKNTLKGSLEEKLNADEISKKELSKKEAERKIKQVVKEKWGKLNTMFGGEDGVTFKKIAQSYIMQDILNHANGYLRKIAARYELIAQPGSLIILVRDNEGGIIRSGNTLSGGESFVVSLALALGLSSLAESNITTDTIFIDEGFGTLSQDWLNNVMNTLEKLNSSSGKHIGMITHMEDLKNKISTYISVERIDASSSTIKIVPQV